VFLTIGINQPPSPLFGQPIGQFQPGLQLTQTVQSVAPEEPRMPNLVPNVPVLQNPQGSDTVFREMDAKELSLDFLDANRDVLELFKTMGVEELPRFYVYNQPKSQNLGLVFHPSGRRPAYR